MLALTESHVQCTKATLQIKDSPIGGVVLGAKIEWRPASGWVVEAAGDVGTARKVGLRVDNRDGGRHVLLNFEGFELPLVTAAMKPLSPFLAEHEIESGTLTLSAECRMSAGDNVECTVGGNIRQLNLNGANVAENVSMDFDVAYAGSGGDAEFKVGLSMREGAVYIEPGFKLGAVKPGFFLAVADEPIDVMARVVRPAAGETQILAAELSHPGTVDMHFAGDLAFVPSLQWGQLDFALQAPDAEKFYTTYMQPIALDTAFGALETAGGVYVKIAGSDSEIDNFILRLDDVHIDDEASRFSMYGLDGEIELHAGTEERESHIGWVGASLYRIQIGPGRIDWVSSERDLRTASWQDVTIFDGELRMDTLEIEDFGLNGSTVRLSGELTPITLSALTAAFGWMPLSGKLSGTIPRLSYSANRLDLDGDLLVKVFDGRVVIRDLAIDRLFSTVPVLSADISFERLALHELTRTFSFGNITGRLDGSIKDLKLQAWRPIRFDASFATPPDDDDPHRISQQAVDNLGRLGAGTGTGLSQGWLGLIPSYSYGRLGIGCQLVNGFCLMSGVEDAPGGGFFILTRGGILPPWIDIKGAGRRIKWQTLVDGIKQISQGNWKLDIGS